MYTLKLKHHFDAAHRLEFHEGLCQNLHGHRWDVKVLIRTNELDDNKLVVDFGDIKKIIDRFDHSTVLKMCESNILLIKILHEMNMKLVVLEESPTAENIALVLKKSIDKLLYVKNSEVTVWESPDASIEYYKNEL